MLESLQRRDVCLDRGLRLLAKRAAACGARVINEKNEATN
jgi:hypothetical protein